MSDHLAAHEAGQVPTSATAVAPGSQYTVLARRFRPQSFAEVVGQQHVGQSLRNAIRGGRVAHAYLFTGARGVGKTSMARILAKALNCPNVVDGVPCNECEICQGISAGGDVDVLEIDGASNRGIDDIRQLRANVSVKSMRTKYKLYIIDEVHMLTKEAFNALLKTLEEPPPNVKFVFCTTEVNKVPDTILSRCQRFDFTTIDTANIMGRLQQIADIEGYEVDAEALELVARRANGSMRDSQSLFDQLLAFGNQHLTADDVHSLLGTASDARLLAMVDGIQARQVDRVLQELDAAATAGVQLNEFIDQLLGVFRDLMIVAGGAEGVPLLGVSQSQRDALRERGRRWGLPTIVTAMQILADTRTKMQRATMGRSLAELGLVRLTLLEDFVSVGALLHDLRSGAIAAPAGGVSKGMASPAGGNPLAGSPLVSGSAAARPAPKPLALPPLTSPTARQNPPPAAAPSPTSRPTGDREPAPTPVRDDRGDAAPPVGNRGANNAANVAPSATSVAAPPQGKPASAAPAGPVAKPAPSPPAHEPAPVPLVEFRPGCESALLSQLIAQMDPAFKDLLPAGVAIAISGPNQLDLTIPARYAFTKSQWERPEKKTVLERLLLRLTGKTLRVGLRLVDGDAKAAASAGAGAKSPPATKRATNVQDPLVQAAIQLFGLNPDSIYMEDAGRG